MAREFRKSNLNTKDTANLIKQTKETNELIDSYKTAIPQLYDAVATVLRDLFGHTSKSGWDQLGYADKRNIATEKEKIEILQKAVAHIDKINQAITNGAYNTQYNWYSSRGVKIINSEDLKNVETIRAILNGHEAVQKSYSNAKYFREDADLNTETVKSLLDLVEMLSNNNIEKFEEDKEIISHIEDFHTKFKKVLDLDNREVEKTEVKAERASETQSKFNIINGFKALFGNYDWFGGISKKDKTAESEPNSGFFNKFTSYFSSTKVEEKAVQIVEPAAKTVLPVNDKMVKDTIHDSFQQYADEMIGAAKGACFDQVIQAQKEYASCMIRRPGVDVKKMGADNCEILEKQAEFLQENCQYVFPIATPHDDLIAQFMEKALTTQAELSDRAISFKAHNDESIFNLIYMAYEEGKSPQELLEATYNAPTSQQQAAIAPPVNKGGENSVIAHDEM